MYMCGKVPVLVYAVKLLYVFEIVKIVLGDMVAFYVLSY
jgi:hypothetical protein